MEKTDLISVDTCSEQYNIEISFINELGDAGLVQFTLVDEQNYVHHDQLTGLEKFIRLHYDLDINLPGIEAIEHMLKRIGDLQLEIEQLKSRVKLYEIQHLS